MSTRMEKRISVSRGYQRDERGVRVDVFDDFFDLVQQPFDLVLGHEDLWLAGEDDEADPRERLDPRLVLVVLAAPVRREDHFVQVHREDVLLRLRHCVPHDVHPVAQRLLGADEEVVVLKYVEDAPLELADEQLAELFELRVDQTADELDGLVRLFVPHLQQREDLVHVYFDLSERGLPSCSCGPSCSRRSSSSSGGQTAGPERRGCIFCTSG